MADIFKDQEQWHIRYAAPLSWPDLLAATDQHGLHNTYQWRGFTDSWLTPAVSTKLSHT